jgi:hypothetical protein
MKLYGLIAAVAPIALFAFAPPAAKAQTITPLAGFSDPIGVAVDSSGDVFVAN